MTANGVTNVPDDDQGEEAANKLERATNLGQISGSTIYNSSGPEMVMILNEWWYLGIKGQLFGTSRRMPVSRNPLGGFVCTRTTPQSRIHC
ncbi:hypothetical protein C487_11941 [Natrinema pallidum DSM 3751]|uniref:Uncharacterized protein n=1 Tax=Natrinema pallidum DSM 3751 TaxID=1227495 RepID=L9YTE2_9EURY|nr:hypothetical protein C487_11941 [Natrinema pallidum DSM 3751]